MQTRVNKTKKIKSCVFCKKSPPEVKITREHVLRSAINKILPGCTGTFVRQLKFDRNTGAPNYQERSIPQSAYNIMVNDVCEKCNGGWMNVKVEQAAEKFLFPLILGNQIELPTEAANILALWAAKTAAVRSLVDAEPYAVPTQHFSWIKENLAPPPSTFIWMGKSEFLPHSWTRQRKFIADYGDNNIQHTHMTTIVIGHLAFFILGCGSQQGEAELAGTIFNLNIQPLFQIWPGTNATHFNKLPALGPEKILTLSGAGFESARPLTPEMLNIIKE